MNKKALLFIIICGMFLVGAPFVVQAVEIPNPLNCEGAEGEECFLFILTKILQVLRSIAIPIAGVMLIVSGFQYLTSAGSEDKANKAKKTMLYTVIGLAIIILAKLIVDVVKDILG